MNKYFITSTGTSIGKTFVTCALIRQLIAQNKSVIALKPIISGWEDDNDSMDTIQIIKAMSRPITQEDIDTISPWRFKEALSPDMAATAEGRKINLQDITNFCKNAENLSDYLLIEGVGGVMVPLNENKTTLDWMEELNIPAILVSGSYLGAISHTLTAINALQNKDIKIHRIIISESENGVDVNDTKSTLQNFTDTPMQIIPRLKDKKLYKGKLDI